MQRPKTENGKGPHFVWIHQNFVSARQPGNSRPVHLVAALLQQGWTVDIVTAQAGYLDDGCNGAVQNVTVQREGNLSIHRLDTSMSRSQLQGRIRSYIKFFTRALPYAFRIRDIDVVKSSTIPLSQTLVAILLSAWRDIPLVIHLGDIWPAVMIETGLLKSFWLIAPMEWLESLAYNCADQIIVVAPAWAKYLEEMGIPREKITLAPTGGDPLYAKADRKTAGADWRSAHGFEDEFLILYAGSLNEYYGLDHVIEAARRTAVSMPHVHWLFLGNGRHRPIIEEAARTLRNVHYFGSIPKDEILPYFMGADAALLTFRPMPLLSSSIPGKTYDYMACGMPIIAFADPHSQIATMVSAAQAGLVVDQYSVRSLVEAVRKTTEMPELRRREMGENGRRWVLTYMSSVDMAYEASAAIDRAYLLKTDRPRLLRLMAAGIRAIGDVWSRRSQKAVRELYSEKKLRQTIESCFQAWLKSRPPASLSEMRMPPPMPKVLSRRNQETPGV